MEDPPLTHRPPQTARRTLNANAKYEDMLGRQAADRRTPSAMGLNRRPPGINRTRKMDKYSADAINALGELQIEICILGFCWIKAKEDAQLHKLEKADRLRE